MKALSLSLILVASMLCSNVLEARTAEPISFKSGSFYGSKVLLLTLNADGSFSYQDHSNPNKPINTSGTWVMHGNRVRLLSASANSDFNPRWRLRKQGKAISSRQGMAFYRLIDSKDCK